MTIKRLVGIFISILVVIVVLNIYQLNSKVYGNDKESILKIINSIEGYENKSIQILEIKDWDKTRVVSFLANSDPAFIQFMKNAKGNFECDSTAMHPGESFALFLINFYEDEIKRFLVVSNQNNEVAKIHLGVNNEKMEFDFIAHKTAVYWIDLPKTSDNSYAFTYEYYNEEGKLIYSSKE